MKVKARLAPMSCPQKYWNKTTSIPEPDELPQDIIDEIMLVWEDIKTGRAKDIQAKKNMIDIYNTIYGTGYDPNTNCGSCLSACYTGMKRLYEKYK
tara:strand:- start:117 stop:404 length:288 start_codon:yes stop_codon:yes gene_type:complete